MTVLVLSQDVSLVNETINVIEVSTGHLGWLAAGPRLGAARLDCSWPNWQQMEAQCILGDGQ